MIKEYFNQYENDIDYEFDVNTVDDIKNERIKNEVLALYKSIDEYTEQKTIMDNKFKQYNKGNKKGYSPDDIVYFCNFHKIKCFGYDWKMQQFITNKNDLSNFNKNLPAFVFYFNDSHIYLIKDTAMRKSLLHSNDKSDIISLISKEANKNKSERKIKVDIPFEEWGDGESINIYITGQRVVNNTFYKLICEGEVYNNGVKSCEKDGIIKFTYKNKNKIIYNPDYHMVNITIENLNNRQIDIKYKFENQRLSTLAMDF
jgi:predicted RND superfamily exporter protein